MVGTLVEVLVICGQFGAIRALGAIRAVWGGWGVWGDWHLKGFEIFTEVGRGCGCHGIPQGVCLRTPLYSIPEIFRAVQLYLTMGSRGR